MQNLILSFGRVYLRPWVKKLNFSTTYHAQTNGQTERTNQIMEDMLRMYVMDRPTKWEDYLQLVEFDYSNGYQTSFTWLCYELDFI